MERVILIKYGELTTKKGNRNFFVKTLYQNIVQKLKGLDVTISKDISRMYIEFNETQLATILACMDHIFGIHMYHVAYKVPTTLECIKIQAVEAMKDSRAKTFKVESKRSDHSFPLSSVELSPLLGGEILKNCPFLQVDVHQPDVTVHVEVRPSYSYIYTDIYHGLGGYPVGTQAKALLMLSGGIDSPVSGYLSLKRGMKIEAVYFEALPHTSMEARNKVITLTEKLAAYTNAITLHIVPFTKLQEAIYQNVDASYCITIMRRMMYRIMERLAHRQKALAIINGESIGQVASQTLTSMSVINAVTNMPVIRPVACLDKLEIIDIAKKIDTYETSILPYEDCCTVFVPKHPVINPNLEDCLNFEKKFDYESLLTETLEQVKHLKISSVKEQAFTDLL